MILSIYKLCVSGLLCLLVSSLAAGEPDSNEFTNLEIGPSYEEALEVIDQKYPAPRNPKIRTIIIYYCWPDREGKFHLLNEPPCAGMARSDTDVIKATYNYFPRGKENVAETHPSFLEGLLSLDLPNDFNLSVSGKTPYELAYENYNSDVVNGRLKVEPVDDAIFDGLQLYVGGLGRWQHWVSRTDYKTRIGNPFLVACHPVTQCHTQLDLGNGWLLGVKFPKKMLSAWEVFLKNIEMSEYHMWR